MILYNLKKNKNKKMPNAYGKYYAYPVVTQTIGMDGLATHMSGHNTPFSPGAIKGMLTDMVICVRELALQGIAVKIDNLAIFSIGIKNKLGADTEKDFSITKNIEGVKLRARATGELMSDKLNLDATLKKATHSLVTAPPTRTLLLLRRAAAPLRVAVALHQVAAVPLRAATPHLLEATIPEAARVNNHRPTFRS